MATYDPVDVVDDSIKERGALSIGEVGEQFADLRNRWIGCHFERSVDEGENGYFGILCYRIEEMSCK